MPIRKSCCGRGTARCPGADCNFAVPKSREMHDASLSPPSLPLAVIIPAFAVVTPILPPLLIDDPPPRSRYLSKFTAASRGLPCDCTVFLSKIELTNCTPAIKHVLRFLVITHAVNARLTDVLMARFTSNSSLKHRPHWPTIENGDYSRQCGQGLTVHSFTTDACTVVLQYGRQPATFAATVP